MPAALEAITVAKGLIVEPSVPMPAPIRMIATPVTESYPAAMTTGISSA